MSPQQPGCQHDGPVNGFFFLTLVWRQFGMNKKAVTLQSFEKQNFLEIKKGYTHDLPNKIKQGSLRTVAVGLLDLCIY